MLQVVLKYCHDLACNNFFLCLLIPWLDYCIHSNWGTYREVWVSITYFMWFLSSFCYNLSRWNYNIPGSWLCMQLAKWVTKSRVQYCGWFSQFEQHSKGGLQFLSNSVHRSTNDQEFSFLRIVNFLDVPLTTYRNFKQQRPDPGNTVQAKTPR